LGDILDGNRNGPNKQGEQCRDTHITDVLGRKVLNMKRVTIASLISLGLVTGVAAPSFAQGASCASRTMIVDRLSKKYGETRQSAGLNQNNGMVEVFASDDTGTWTILVTMPNGTSCLMAAGKAWQGETASVVVPDEGA